MLTSWRYNTQQMKVRARWFWKDSFKNLPQILVQVFHKRYMLFQILSPQLFVIRTSNILSLTNNCINSCTGLYREGIISYPDLLLTKLNVTSGQIRFCTRDCLQGMLQAMKAACRPIEGEQIPTYKDFRFKIFRISTVFIHSTTNGNRHLMKSGRAACRPIEGEEIPTYRDFSF